MPTVLDTAVKEKSDHLVIPVDKSVTEQDEQDGANKQLSAVSY